MDDPSSFFSFLVKNHGWNSLLSDTGQEFTQPGQIRGQGVEFYSALYTREYKKNGELKIDLWDILAHDMLEVFDESLVSGSLLSCRRASCYTFAKKWQ